MSGKKGSKGKSSKSGKAVKDIVLTGSITTEPRPAGADGATNAAVLDETSELFRSFLHSYSTSTGVSVTSDSAIASVAVLACLIVRAESLMLCPVDVFKKEGRSREPFDEHPAAMLLADEPNPLISSEEFWRWKQNTEDLRGNAYARIEWYRGKPVALWPMIGPKPQIIYGGPSNRQLIYRYAGDQFTAAGDYPMDQIMHFKGPLLSATPYEAKSLVQVTAENIGLGIASEQFFARFLGNGSHFPMYLEHPDALGKKDLEALQAQLDDGRGLLPAGTLRIFDRGLKLQQNDINIKDADLTLQQRWILEQVCRTWRVPLPLVQDLTHGTYTNSEQADLWLSKYTAAPIAKNSEGVIRRRLFLPSERRGPSRVYAKFNINALLRGDFAARAAGYSILINCGMLAPNEGRALEDWNAYEGGDEFRVPLNTGPAGEQAAALAGGDPMAMEIALKPLMQDAQQRILARHHQNLQRGRGLEDTLAFAGVVFEPIARTARALGVQFDPTRIAAETLDLTAA